MPVKTVPELIAYAKANPGKVNMASAGNGSAPHMAGELFKMMTGVNMVHVPYRGQGPALTDLLGGEVQVLFATAPGTTDYIASGRLRALAVTTAARAQVAPELPPVGDFVPGYETSQWYGMCAPAKTPAEIIGKLNKEINAAIADARHESPPRRDRRRTAAGHAGRVRQADRGRDGEMGQGGSGGGAEAGLRVATAAGLRRVGKSAPQR